MNHNQVKTYRYRVGKNKFLVIKIFQAANASADSGNALASNAVNVQILKKAKRGHSK